MMINITTINKNRDKCSLKKDKRNLLLIDTLDRIELIYINKNKNSKKI
jgi:hypothetical protein